MGKGIISTRAGDKGRTGVGGGGRVDKDDARIEALGDLDETNSVIGVLRSLLPAEHDWEEGLRRIQTEMMNLMGHVATPSDVERPQSIPLPDEAVVWMEDWMQKIEDSLADTTEYFLLPGGNQISAQCHIVRTVARRAERRLVTLNKADPVVPSVLKFVNRLSDLMFKLARQETHRKGLTENRWRLFKPERNK
ncbi:cob(I)yrinic acid a,c-diamide adenosyltransferase [Pelagicoccus albus]|uniref:Corrinoid adenosyltransferase n=1 Tax=Pelagicoccus albus TaxID=415222 RepID=A0A7X1EA03_9BACT|nr:cob(I)yrinic acid a,c-diamide adenosyltransferase [Pelagicoccus albus]MBC2607728.1 cob(I)yrinic acid a,c-diamide adenosyltransferase [Pelagicoccus albus]